MCGASGLMDIAATDMGLSFQKTGETPLNGFRGKGIEGRFGLSRQE